MRTEIYGLEHTMAITRLAWRHRSFSVTRQTTAFQATSSPDWVKTNTVTYGAARSTASTTLTLPQEKSSPTIRATAWSTGLTIDPFTTKMQPVESITAESRG